MTETVSATPITGEFELQKSSLKQPVNKVKMHYSDNIDIIITPVSSSGGQMLRSRPGTSD